MLISEQPLVQQREQGVSQEFGDVSEEGFLPVERCRRQYLDYLGAKVLEFNEQKESRHYFHGAQWTAEHIRILRNRRQPIITYAPEGHRAIRLADYQIVDLVRESLNDCRSPGHIGHKITNDSNDSNEHAGGV